MFTFFKKTRSLLSKNTEHSIPSITENSKGETIVDQYKMTLDERKAWRADMLRISLREVFTSLNFTSGMYRYRSIALDGRGHYYAVMIETTKLFDQSEHYDLSAIEKILQDHTFKNYGITVDAVYWKANDRINMFRRSQDTDALPSPSTLPTAHSTGETQPSPLGLITAEELASFRRAIATNNATLTARVHGKEYATDLAPLQIE